MANNCSEESIDMSREAQRLFKEKQKMRTAATEYYMKTLYNPYREVNVGPPFDPALQRFSAMSAYRPQYFQPKARTIAAALFALFGPVSLLYYVLHTRKQKKEAKYRAGLVRYEDREYKLMI